MQIKIFTIPISAPNSQEEEVNKFLRSHRVMTLDRHFTSEGGGYWTLLVTYQENGSPEAPAPVSRTSRKDYREVLNEDQFARFAQMRDIRREVAKQENIPAYAVFTDEELSQIVQLPELSIASIKGIKGIGKRAEKYGGFLIGTESILTDEESGDRCGTKIKELNNRLLAGELAEAECLQRFTAMRSFLQKASAAGFEKNVYLRTSS